MQGTWQPEQSNSRGAGDPFESDNHHLLVDVGGGQTSSSMGGFIERSTSAPPGPSSASKDNLKWGTGGGGGGDSLVGNDLLEHMSSGGGGGVYDPDPAALHSQSVTPLIRNMSVSSTNSHRQQQHQGSSSGGGAVDRDLGANLFLGESSQMLTSGRATAPSSYLQPSGGGGLDLGDPSRGRPRSGSHGGALMMEGVGDFGRQQQQPGLVRSSSAQPSIMEDAQSSSMLVGPPPGLRMTSSERNLFDAATSSSLQNNTINQQQQRGLGIRRPASTGRLMGSQSAVRPSAKTLMDLIQEDDTPGAADSSTLSMQRNYQQQPFFQQQQQQQQQQQRRQYDSIGGGQQVIDRRSASPAIARSPAPPGDYGGLVDGGPQLGFDQQEKAYQQKQFDLEQDQRQYQLYSNNQQSEPSYQRSLIEAKLLKQQQELHLQQELQMQQQHMANAEWGRRQSPDETRSPYSTLHHLSPSPQLVSQLQQQQQPPQQPGSHQQMFYNGGGPAPPQQQQHRMEQLHQQQQNGVPMNTRQQVLPSGQTVYLNTPSPQPGYGYTTVHYSPNGGQHQVIHHHQAAPMQQGMQTHHQHHPNDQQQQQFVSVVPIQAGAGGQPQLAYWQAAGDQPQNSMGPTTVAIVGTPGGTPLAVNRLSQQQQQQSPNRVHHVAVHGHGGGVGHYGGGGGGAPGGRGGRGEKPGRGARRGGAQSRRGDSKASGQAACSALLTDFRNSKVRDWTMHQIEGSVVEFCQDQNGSRFIQQRLEMGDVLEQQVVMREVLPAIRQLRNDVFGNYVVQKLLDFGTPQMKEDIRRTLEGEMLPLSLQMYGCRVVQKAFEALDEEDLPRMLQEFHSNALTCIHDQNGNHVIQKCIEVLNTRAKKAEQAGDPDRAAFLRDEIAFVVEDVIADTASLSCHPYGCRVLQRILEHCNEEKKILVLDQVKKCHQKLMDDQYGNYVIQHVLQFGRACDRDSILAIVVEAGLLGLSRQKYASNVVEKLLKYGNGGQRRAIAREMLKKVDGRGVLSPGLGEGAKSVVLHMVRDAYANYVVQTTLDVIPESKEKQDLLQELNDHAEELKNYTFAKHIVAKLAVLSSK